MVYPALPGRRPHPAAALKSVDKRLIAAYNLVRLRERGKI